MVLEQVGMGAGALEIDFLRRVVNFIDKHPVTLNVAAERPFQLAVKRVIFILRRQGLLGGNHIDDFKEFVEIPALFSHQLPFFLKTFV
jgi:hypothetical protein